MHTSCYQQNTIYDGFVFNKRLTTLPDAAVSPKTELSNGDHVTHKYWNGDLINSNMYNNKKVWRFILLITNSIGPRTDPWRVPMKIWPTEDRVSPKLLGIDVLRSLGARATFSLPLLTLSLPFPPIRLSSSLSPPLSVPFPFPSLLLPLFNVVQRLKRWSVSTMKRLIWFDH